MSQQKSEAIRFDVVRSTTKEYTCEGVLERWKNLKNSDVEQLRYTCPEGQFIICTGWSNPNPGTWVLD